MVMNQAVHVFVFDGLADWEIGRVTYDLRTANGIPLRTFALTDGIVTTGGGLRIVPDKTVKDVAVEDISLLILPGGSMWESENPEALLPLVSSLFQNHVPVAAICGATIFLAQNGFLNGRSHTSNGKSYLLEGVSDYEGEDLYVDEPIAATDDLITANGKYPIEFSHAILGRLKVYEAETLDAFLAFWKG
ncbi:DJ-1/PfpI family protein [Brevibacillus choshinensis]|uniref:DJ-1/PfpI family protein n=1 Tax=Brevibacillus choshinensis TaxID=54911 RepID=UPI002E1BF45F|nr:DJ-1/PfpI family protein [Brevibacillus choshinensis]